MTDSQPITQKEERYAVFESSQKWAYHGTGVLTETQLKNMIIDSLRLEDEDADESNYFEDVDMDDAIYAFVERETRRVYEHCSSGIVSVVRLSDGEVWGEQAQLGQARYHEPYFLKFSKP